MWHVDLSGDCSGRFDNFLMKAGALKFIEENNYYKYITLNDTRIKDNPDGKKGDITCEHQWIGEFGHVFCLKCSATINVACNHTGSVGCATCSGKCATELNNSKDKGTKTYETWHKTTLGDKRYCQYCGLETTENKCKNKYCYLFRERP